MTTVPTGYATVNPFIITRNADGLLVFLREVFDAVDRPEARTMDEDGLLLHAEVRIGDSTVLVAERKPGWPYFPALLQVYVDDVAATLERAEARGAEIVTKPTDFFGDVFSRFIDGWGNLWWVYSSSAAAEQEWDGGDSVEEWADAGDQEWTPTPELIYIHDTLIDAIPRLRE